MHPFHTIIMHTYCTHQPTVRSGLLVLAALMAAFPLGCSSGPVRKPVYPTSGSVTVNGKPAVRARVIFHPLGVDDPQAERPSGEVGEDGKFQLATYSAADGAPAGEYIVTVLWQDAPSGPGGDAETPDKLGGKYASPKTSSLRAKVAADGRNEIPPFVLKK